MKRRTFLTVSSTVGLAGAVSGASVVSSVYSSMSTSLLLEEFNIPIKNVMDKFMSDVTLNTQTLELDKKFVKHTVLPVQIISKKSEGDSHSITYKNKSGEHVTLSITKGVEQIRIFQS